MKRPLELGDTRRNMHYRFAINIAKTGLGSSSTFS